MENNSEKMTYKTLKNKLSVRINAGKCLTHNILLDAFAEYNYQYLCVSNSAPSSNDFRARKQRKIYNRLRIRKLNDCENLKCAKSRDARIHALCKLY